jgi:hypothetical protein
MPKLGGASGFKTTRDLALFVVGLGVCVFHIFTTPPADLSIPLLMFGGGLAGGPAILKNDEKKGE